VLSPARARLGFYPVGRDLRRSSSATAGPRPLVPLGFFLAPAWPWRQQLRQLRIELAIGMTTLPCDQACCWPACAWACPLVVSEAENYRPAKTPAAPWAAVAAARTSPKAALHLSSRPRRIAHLAEAAGLARQDGLACQSVAWRLAGLRAPPRPRPTGSIPPGRLLTGGGNQITIQKGFDRAGGRLCADRGRPPQLALCDPGARRRRVSRFDQVAACADCLRGRRAAGKSGAGVPRQSRGNCGPTGNARAACSF